LLQARGVIALADLDSEAPTRVLDATEDPHLRASGSELETPLTADREHMTDYRPALARHPHVPLGYPGVQHPAPPMLL
jgi:hypothetical protein